MTKIVGIDPGLAATGVGVVSGRGVTVAGYSFGCITTSQSLPLAERLDCIFSRLQQLFSDETPDIVVLEDVFSLKEYPRSGISLGQVSGVVMLAAFRAGMSCVQIPVREAKQVLTGNGNASKLQLEKAVRGHLEHPGPIRPFHAADALGLALIGLFRCEDRKRAPAAVSPASGGAPHPVRRRLPGGATSAARKGCRTP
jgi:crossover junction endodeoxyribonuclease RuvC